MPRFSLKDKYKDTPIIAHWHNRNGVFDLHSYVFEDNKTLGIVVESHTNTTRWHYAKNKFTNGGRMFWVIRNNRLYYDELVYERSIA